MFDFRTASFVRPAGGRPRPSFRPSTRDRARDETDAESEREKKKNELNPYLRHDVPLAHGDDGHRHAQALLGEDLRHARLGPERADAGVEARARRRRRRAARRRHRGRFHAKLRRERGRREGHHRLSSAFDVRRSVPNGVFFARREEVFPEREEQRRSKTFSLACRPNVRRMRELLRHNHTDTTTYYQYLTTIVPV